MKIQFDWKRLLPNAIILLVFIIASAIYFWPALQGKTIYAGDNINGYSAVQEGKNYYEQTGESSYWTNSMFAGMPNYQIGGNGGYAIDQLLRPIRWFFAWGNRNTAFIFLFYLCAFFLLLRSFKVDKWLSMAGAFAIALSSYFFVIIAAQHHGKCYSITWMTLTLIGFILTYRKQYGWGALMVMFFTYIGFFMHPQMSYYMCMLIGVLFFAELAIAIKEREWKHLAIATLVFAVSFGVGMGMGSANVFANQEYARETMRGGHSDLQKVTDGENKTEGLDLDYATAWSYGIDETMTFLIPNFEGGASGYKVGEKSQLYHDLVAAGVPKNSAKGFCQSAPTYRGDKAFTSGPVYMGAIICFLFLLGLIIVPGPYKWALLAATLFSLLLSWGRHFMPLTELFFQYFPMYNKFRAVESILIVAEITIPLLGMLAVQRIVSQGVEKEQEMNKTLTRHAILLSGGIVAAICLSVALFAGSIDVTSTYDAQWKGQVGDRIYQMILDQRTAMIRSDAWRSLIFVVLGTALVWLYNYKPFKTMYLGLALTALIVADMWPVDKRFCNDDNFVTHKKLFSAFDMQPYEKQLLETDDSYYRVFNLTVNTFNDARTSYYLKSIGGYSAAKLRRYQDIIDEHLSKMNWKVINMLNTKYIITKGPNGQPYPHYNPDAMGNCWLVDSLVAVNNANDESEALRTLDLHHVAVYDETLADNAHIGQHSDAQTLMAFEKDQIVLTNYTPKRLSYHTEAERPHVAVFSEIFYNKGWTATIDGQQTDIFRVNYLLRAINLPAGEHEIVFTFEPNSVKKGNMLSLCCLAIFLLSLIGVVGYKIYRRRTKSIAAPMATSML